MSDIIFISGHRDITHNEFMVHYAGQINNLCVEGCSFVVGDCQGVDYMAQKVLKEMGAKNVIVFHMDENPNYYVSGHSKSGGYKSDVHRDFAMTLASDRDLCWVREGKERSGTAQNIERRKLKEQGVTSIEEIMTLDANVFL